MEIETVMSYIANSVNPDGVRAQEISESLARGHPGGAGPRAAVREPDQGALRRRPRLAGFSAEQSYLQPPEHQTDIVHVIKGVIEAESGAISYYNEIIEFAGEHDPVTEDMVIAILRDEQGHMREFEGFLREYEAEGLA